MTEHPETSTARTYPSHAIRDAATLIVVRHDVGKPPCVLMGRRHADAIFLPNKYVFPGGRFDDDDLDLISEVHVTERDHALLSDRLGPATSPQHVGAFALTALRETYEETGIIIGKPMPTRTLPRSKAWHRFVETGYRPDTSGLRFFARAITPPGRTRRYDTRFFVTTEAHISRQFAPLDQELSEVAWVAVADAQNRDVASITRLILKDLFEYLETPQQDRAHHPVPFYFFENGAGRRVLLSHQQGPA